MKIILAFVLIQFTLAFKEWWEESNAFDLTADNFFEIVGKERYVVVEFYTKWCRYCRIMHEEYNKFAEIMKEKRKDVLVARLEAGANAKIAQEYEIKGYPRIVMFYPNNKEIQVVYQYERTADVFVNWVDKHAPPIQSFYRDGKLDENLIDEKVKENEKTVDNQGNDEYAIITNELKEIKKQVDEQLTTLRKENEEYKNKVANLEKQLKEIQNKETKKKLTPKFSMFGLCIIIVCMFILVSAFLTFKKIYSKSNKD